MDNSQYHPNGMNHSNSPYGALPGIAPHQLQQGGSNLTPHTLPPLQASQHAMQNIYGGGSAPHTPRTPATPNTPGAGPSMGGFPQMPQARPPYQMMQGNGYQPQQQQGYRPSGPLMPQTSVSMTHTQAIAPAPAPRMPQQLRPMPTNPMQHMQGGMQPYGQNGMLSQIQDMEPPTHVVGSQGRRGILPSAPGRPPVSQTGAGAGKNAMIPAKDADGKFPCPHCTKTYLHAKHLKRHLLRHTGDRPYMCVLCRDTFSRSDILKRHFQKCSIRRGNPTNATHLSHQAHLKKSHPGPHKAPNGLSNENELMGSNGMGFGGMDPNAHVPDAGPNMADNGRGMVGPNQGVPSRASFDQGYGGGGIATTMPTGMNPSSAFNIPHHSYGQGYDFAFQQPNNVPDGLMAPSYNANSGSHNAIKSEQYPIKAEPSSFPPNYISNGVTSTTSLPAWNLHSDPLEEISNRLIFFCFPNNQVIGKSNDIRAYLSASNIKHFLDHFTSFQGHFPVLHIPTFRIADAFDGLLLAMICIGAVYSDRMSSTQVREMMELAKAVIERNSPIYSIAQSRDNGFADGPVQVSKSDVEQMTAIFMMQVLFTWHGTPLQREKARQEFPVVAEIARRAGLTKPAMSMPFSLLHQPNLTIDNSTLANFDWHAWIEQEQRSRLMFALFLTDAALAIYFNMEPKFGKDEIRLPLPADDAAWDSQSATDCAEALGLHGPVLARSRNPEGSRRPKQPEMHSALNALTHNIWELQPASTNLFSKFVLIHALHIQLWSTLRQMSLQEAGQLGSQLYPSSGTSTPVSQQDWLRAIDPSGNAVHSASNSGRATPVDGSAQSSPLTLINAAFDKWKKAWDEDMSTQFPPASAQYRRFGFCRDAVHYYWLAKYLMKNTRVMDWQVAPDQRFSQAINLLKSVKAWVVSDSATRGEELGSISDIINEYGVTDLTLDMAQLFRPISRENSPIMGVHTSTIS